VREHCLVSASGGLPQAEGSSAPSQIQLDGDPACSPGGSTAGTVKSIERRSTRERVLAVSLVVVDSVADTLEPLTLEHRSCCRRSNCLRRLAPGHVRASGPAPFWRDWGVALDRWA
jgi:hypothetical protein